MESLVSFSHLTNISTVLSSNTLPYSNLLTLSGEAIESATWFHIKSAKRDYSDSVGNLQSLFEEVPLLVEEYLGLKNNLIHVLQESIMSYRNHVGGAVINITRPSSKARSNSLAFPKWKEGMRYAKVGNKILGETVEMVLPKIKALDSKLGRLQELLENIGLHLVFVRYSQQSKRWSMEHVKRLYSTLTNGVEDEKELERYVEIMQGYPVLGGELTVFDVWRRAKNMRGLLEGLSNKGERKSATKERWDGTEFWDAWVESETDRANRLGAGLGEEAARLSQRRM